MDLLNARQQEAIAHVEGPLLVLAGAGSGKTRVVTHRIARLIELGVPPSDILAVTFTNKAADEMRARVRSLTQAGVLACTFHSLGARILRESISEIGYSPDFLIYDEDESEKLLKAVLESLQLSQEKGIVREMRSHISTAKNGLIDPDEAEDPLVRQVYAAYASKMRACNAVDFDDLLYLTVRLLQRSPSALARYQARWQFLLIDEYQDTNFAQYTLAKLLAAHGNLFAVGDPDQSIYSWRGARYQNILNFEADFPGAKTIALDQNYRSTNRILRAANSLIAHNSARYEKMLWSALGKGEKIQVYVAQHERQEAAFVATQLLKNVQSRHLPLNEIAIFYRTNAQSRPFEDALLAHKIPYTIVGGLSFYQRKEIKDVLAFLRMIISDTDLISFLRTINLPKRGIGATTLEKWVQGAADRGIPILPFCDCLLTEGSLPPRQRQGLLNYLALIRSLRDKRGSLKIHELIAELIASSNYLSVLAEDPETEQDKKENIDELIGKALEWEEEAETPSLSRFLEELSLRSSSDEAGAGAAVQLMTLHNSKGLEFRVVFLVGLEEELFPHVNALGSPEALEEERRLCYVGMTRAKELLYLCSAVQRYMWGTLRLMRPSRFLKEIPAEFLHNLSPHLAPRSHSDSEEILPFAPGDQVIHAEFGQGIIQKAFHSSYGLAYDIYFPDADATRTIVAKFAKLRSG